MKKIVFYFSMLLLSALMITGCSKKDDGQDNVKTNYLEYGGKSHPVTNAMQLFYGHYYSSISNNISLVLATDTHYVVFELFVPNANTKLVAGDYQPSDTYQSYTVSAGLVLDDGGNAVYSMTTAVVTVKLNGDNYTIDIDGKLDNNTSIKGNYTGLIAWEDDSDDSGSSYGSMTIAEGSNQQTIDFDQAQQIRAATSTSNRFILFFSQTFIITLGTSDLTAPTIPAGNYTVSTTSPIPEGAFNVSMNIPGVSGVINASSGSFNVQKSGSNYSITFSFTTNSNPVRTVTGSYSGPIPLS